METEKEKAERDGVLQEFRELLKKVQESIRESFSRPQDSLQLSVEEQRTALRQGMEELDRTMGAVDGEVRGKIGAVMGHLVRLMFEHWEPLRSYTKIDKYLRILLGDTFMDNHHPIEPPQIGKVMESLIKGDATFEELAKFALEPREGDRWLDTVIPTLDMIFEQRYGWPEGKAKTMTITEMCLALENAMEQDAPEKPSVWEMTKGGGVKEG